jgi:DNA-binding XRE family transcriptional regulator
MTLFLDETTSTTQVMMQIRNEFAVWLRHARIASSMTAAKFAEIIGVSRITLWRWESGKTEAPRWLRIVAEHAFAGTPRRGVR